MQIYTAMKQPPCKDCTERKIGCHGKCERYKAFKEYHEAEKQQKIREGNAADYFIESALRNRKRRRMK